MNFTPVPQEFDEEVARAAESGERERLALLALDVQGFPWEMEGLRAVGRAQFKANYRNDARSTLEALRLIDPNDSEANLLLGTIHQRLEQPQVTGRPDHVILFTGHRVDAPKRPEPRFPADCEARARAALGEAVERVMAIAGGPILGIAGAASGGDILFHEVCRELGVATKICLALPPDQYVAASVKPSGAQWEERFFRIGADQATAVLSSTPELPGWLQAKKGYDIWQRNNLWELCHALVQDADHMTLIALWDGRKGDGPGGTEHMVETARRRNARIDILNTRIICGLGKKNKN